MKFAHIALLAALPLAACQTTSSDGIQYTRDRKYTRVLEADNGRIRLNGFYQLDTRCRNLGTPAIRVVTDGMQGAVISRQERGNPDFPSDNPRAKCNRSKQPATAVYYISTGRRGGDDQISFEVRWRDGEVWRESYTVRDR